MRETYSLFIGRYQPLHKGHIELIRTVIREGKRVCIALRDTPKSKENPFSIKQREKMFKQEFCWELIKGQMKIIKIPDIAEVCHGRKVGWRIREIRLSDELEKISGTKIRNGYIHNRQR